jgi:hypothetical protein
MRLRPLRLYTGAIIALSLSGITAHAANLVMNGDFETGSLSGWTVFTTANGSNGPGRPSVDTFDTGLGPSFSVHFNVGQVVFTPGDAEGGGLTQTVSVVTSGMYTVGGTFGELVNVGGNSDAGVFSILIDSTVVATHTFGNINAGDTLIGSLNGSISLTTGPHTFELLITRTHVGGTNNTPEEFVDNLSLVQATPEPSTVLLVAAGLGGLALVRRKQ